MEPSHLKQHVKSVHEGITYNCNICDHKASQPCSLRAHIKTVHLKEGYSHQCNICEYRTSIKTNLSTHVENLHQKSGNITCSECNKSLQKISLKRHMKLFHSVEHQYYCKICTFHTIHFNSLKRHRKKVHQKC